MSDKILQELRENTSNLDNAIDKFVEQNNRMQDPLKTEFDFLKWLDEGRMVVLGGGSGLGKTAYVLQLIYNLASKNKDRKDGVIGIYASSEMMVEELTMRLIVNQEVIKKLLEVENIYRLAEEKTLFIDEELKILFKNIVNLQLPQNPTLLEKELIELFTTPDEKLQNHLLKPYKYYLLHKIKTFKYLLKPEQERLILKLSKPESQAETLYDEFSN